MKTVLIGRARQKQTSGLMLVECMVYMSMWAVVIGIAFAAFYGALDNSKGLRRNANDIVRVIHAGEVWREDVRSASGPIVNETIEVGTVLQIPRGTNSVMYLFTGTNVLRAAETGRPWVEALSRVKVSSMAMDAGSSIRSWRWEVELASLKKNPRIRPVFSFQAVPRFQEQP